jgi:hypothetical protein
MAEHGLPEVFPGGRSCGRATAPALVVRQTRRQRHGRARADRRRPLPGHAPLDGLPGGLTRARIAQATLLSEGAQPPPGGANRAASSGLADAVRLPVDALAAILGGGPTEVAAARGRDARRRAHPQDWLRPPGGATAAADTASDGQALAVVAAEGEAAAPPWGRTCGHGEGRGRECETKHTFAVRGETIRQKLRQAAAADGRARLKAAWPQGTTLPWAGTR